MRSTGTAGIIDLPPETDPVTADVEIVVADLEVALEVAPEAALEVDLTLGGTCMSCLYLMVYESM